MKFACSICLLMLLLVSGMDAQLQCNPCGDQYLMLFQERTNTDYAIKENSIMYDLDAVTLCFFARDNPNDSTYNSQHPYSYAVPGADNEFLFCTTPVLRVLILGTSRDAAVGLDDDAEWHHICVTWSSANGDYEFFKDGVSVGSGSGFNSGGHITSGGTTVIGQDQDEVGGGFDSTQAFVGDLTQVNVWGAVLSASDIQAQASTCHISQGSVNWWSQFKDNVHGGVVIVEP